MKTTFTSIVLSIGLVFALQAQDFQIRVYPGTALDAFGAQVGDYRVEVKALTGGAVLPTTADILTDLSYGMYWTDPNIDSLGHACYVFIGTCLTVYTNFLGYDMGPGGYVTQKSNGEIYMPFGNTAGSDPFPQNWVVDTWYLIDVLEVIGTGGGDVCITHEGYVQEGTNWAMDANIGVSNVDYSIDTVGGPCEVVLPLTLLSFTAQAYEGHSALLSWTTANEYNSSHFVVERSVDRITWEELGKVKATGESVGGLNYQYVDENVYIGRSPNARFYYRLMIVDRDGSAAYSNIDVVQFGNEKSVTSVYLFPNPSTDGVNVVLNYTEENSPPAQMHLYNGLGQLVYSKEVSEGSTFEFIDFAKTNVFSGTYTLQVMDQTNGIIATEKLVVQR